MWKRMTKIESIIGRTFYSSIVRTIKMERLQHIRKKPCKEEQRVKSSPKANSMERATVSSAEKESNSREAPEQRGRKRGIASKMSSTKKRGEM